MFDQQPTNLPQHRFHKAIGLKNRPQEDVAPGLDFEAGKTQSIDNREKKKKARTITISVAKQLVKTLETERNGSEGE